MPGPQPLLQEEQRHSSSSRTSARTEFFLFAFCCLTCLQTGSLYAFPTIEVDLRDWCGWSGSDLAQVYSLGQVFNTAFGLWIGLLNTRFGVGYLLTYAGILMVAGTVGWWTSIKEQGQCSSSFSVAMYYGIIQHSNSGMYQAMLYFMLARTPENRRGMVVGSLYGSNGLCALFLAALYEFLSHDLKQWVVIVGAVLSTFCFVGAAILHQYEIKEETSSNENDEVMINEIPDNEQLCTSEISTAASMTSVTSIERNEARRRQGLSSVTIVAENAKRMTVKGTLSSVTFWVFVMQFALLQSVASGFIIGNMGLILESLGFDESQRVLATSLFQGTNGLSRFGWGLLIDLVGDRMARARYFFITSCLLTIPLVALIAFKISPAYIPWSLLPFPFTTLIYGGNWTILIVTMTHYFGKTNLWLSMNVVLITFAIVLKGVSLFVANEYDKAKDPNAPFCTPAAECFGNAAIGSLGLCAICAAGGLLVFCRGIKMQSSSQQQELAEDQMMLDPPMGKRVMAQS